VAGEHDAGVVDVAARLCGADVDELRALAGEVGRAGDRVASLGRQLNRIVLSSSWRGPDADTFRTDWSIRHRSALLDAAAALTGATESLHRNADEQDTASRPDGGSGGAAGPGPGVGSAVPGTMPGAAVDEGSREDQRRQSRLDRDGDDAQADPDHAIPGPRPYPAGLGPGVPGTHVGDPEPPAWTPPDNGADANGPSWNTEHAGLGDRAKEWAVRQAANAVSATWPDAARNLHHYLGNSGDTLSQPVDSMLGDLPKFAGRVHEHEQLLGSNAVLAAREAGATGPMTFPVNTEWHGYYAGPDQSKNWYYATGGFSYNVTGHVTVYPPTTPGGQWRYDLDSVVNTRDRYNWDGGKSTQIGPITVTDRELQEFHRKGLAQEFNMVGASSHRSVQGTG